MQVEGRKEQANTFKSGNQIIFGRSITLRIFRITLGILLRISQIYFTDQLLT